MPSRERERERKSERTRTKRRPEDVASLLSPPFKAAPREVIIISEPDDYISSSQITLHRIGKVGFEEAGHYAIYTSGLETISNDPLKRIA